MAKPLTNRQKKNRLIERLITAEVISSDIIAAMNPAEFVTKIPDITSEELRMLLDLQEVVKDGALYDWLCVE